MKKITIPKEVLYIIALLLLSFGVSLSVVADLGISTCSAPGLILSQKIAQILPANAPTKLRDVLTSLTFGEWCVQVIMLFIFCLIIRKFKPIYLTSFVTAAIYGVFLYIWQCIPAFNPNLHVEFIGGVYYPIYLRIIFLILGISIIALSVAIFFKTYFYPQVYNFQEKGYMQHFHWKNVTLVKIIFDSLYGLISFILVLILFQTPKVGNYGIWWGTLVSMLATGPLIGIFTKLLDKTIKTKTLLPKWEETFKIENQKGY